MLDISIQIINYNTKQFLKRCIETVINDLKESSLKYQIHIWDNNSEENLESIIHEYAEHPQIFIHLSKANIGFGAANNRLSKMAKSKLVLILNPDVIFCEKQTIKRLIETMNSDTSIKTVGPKLVNESGIQKWDHGEHSGIRGSLALKLGQSYWRPRKNLAFVAWVTGACMLIDRSAFDSIGGFDEKFFLYKEDEDICLRIRQLGFKICYDPTISVYHYGSVVASKVNFAEGSVNYFIEKHYSHYRFLSLLLLMNRIGFLLWRSLGVSANMRKLHS